MFECPVKYFENNIIVGDDGGWAGYKLEGFHFDNLGYQKSVEILNQLTYEIASVISEQKILILPTGLRIDERYRGLINSLDREDIVYEEAKDHMEQTSEYLQNRERSKKVQTDNYQTYIFVKLLSEEESDPFVKAKNYFDYFFYDPINAINTHINTDSKDILESRMQHYENVANEFLYTQSMNLSMREIEPTEIQYLLKRTTRRGIEEEIRLNTMTKTVKRNGVKKRIYSDWVPYAQRKKTYNGEDEIIRPYSRDIINLFSGAISTDEKRSLSIDHHDGGRSYQTFLAVAHTPVNMYFPGCEWYYHIQQMNVQAEICIHVKNIEYYKAIKKIEGKKKEIKSQLDNIKEAKAKTPEEVIQGDAEGDELKSELKADQHPLVRAGITICLSGASMDEIDQKSRAVMQYFKRNRFIVERPVSDQFKLFLQHIPGAKMYSPEYSVMLPPKTVAGGFFGVNNELGDHEGQYIGYTVKDGKPVNLDMSIACHKNMSASVTITGPLGSGKSVLANYIAYLHALLGAFVLLIDPKGDRGKWVNSELFPPALLKRVLNVVTLSSDDSFRGKLDPFIIYKDNFEEAKNLAWSIVAELFDLKLKDDEYIVFSKYVNQLKNNEKPCMAKLCDIFDEVPDDDKHKDTATKLAERIRALKEMGMSKLLFGYGDEEAISITKRMTVIQTQNFNLAKSNKSKDNYTTSELVSAVIMMVLGDFAKKFATTPRYLDKEETIPAFSSIVFDEAYSLAKTERGMVLYDELARIGRYFNSNCIFLTHSILDIPEAIKNAITYKFCYRAENAEEAERILIYLGLEVNEKNIKMLLELGKPKKKRIIKRDDIDEDVETPVWDPVCLFMDMHKRISAIYVDLVFQHLLDTFNSTPARKKQGNEEAV